MPARYVIGMDCSTTATKAVVWDMEGNAVAEGRATFPLSSPEPGWGEQNAEDWWRSTRDALRQAAGGVDANQIGAIGITIQRETFVCLDEHNRPVRPAILWLDSRAGKQVAKYGSDKVHELTGKPPNPTPGFYKMLWLRENEPESLDRAHKVVDVHGFLVHRMTNQWKTSWATADPLGLVDLRSFDWSDELLGMVGLTREQMAEIHPPGEVLGELADEVAAEVGIPPGTPVVAGSGDGQSAGLGANITRPGRAYLNLGTAVVLPRPGTLGNHVDGADAEFVTAPASICLPLVGTPQAYDAVTNAHTTAGISPFFARSGNSSPLTHASSDLYLLARSPR